MQWDFLTRVSNNGLQTNKTINKQNYFHLLSFLLKNLKYATSNKNNHRNVSHPNRSSQSLMYSTNDCNEITEKLIGSIFLGHIPDVQNQNGWAWESKFLIIYILQVIILTQHPKVENQWLGCRGRRMWQILLRHIFEYKVQTDFIPRSSIHEKWFKKIQT